MATIEQIRAKRRIVERGKGDLRHGGRTVDEPSDRAGVSKPGRRETPEAEANALPSGLYLVATPIGNLADITLRALSVLEAADRICCEDTRVTRRLLSRYGIKKPLQPYHDRNAERARPAILAALRAGESVALVSDAGTPLVSDPGYKLVRAAIAENVEVMAIPGPSAALTALLVSGLPPDHFLFAGFLPRQQSARRRALEECAGLKATLVFFERPSRLAGTLTDMAAVLGERSVAVARELTKIHEEVRRGTLAELAAFYRKEGPPRGEAAIVVAPAQATVSAADALDASIAAALGKRPLREIAASLAAETGIARRVLYRRALALKGAKAKGG